MKPAKAILLSALLAISCSLAACDTSNIGSGRSVSVEQAEAKNCNFDDNLDLTADQFISKCCKSGIRREFPGDYYQRTLREIASDKSQEGKKANKLLRQARFRK